MKENLSQKNIEVLQKFSNDNSPLNPFQDDLRTKEHLGKSLAMSMERGGGREGGWRA